MTVREQVHKHISIQLIIFSCTLLDFVKEMIMNYRSRIHNKCNLIITEGDENEWGLFLSDRAWFVAGGDAVCPSFVIF